MTDHEPGAASEPSEGGEETTAPSSETRLRTAPLEVVGRFADASNATLLVRLLDRDARSLEDLAERLGRTPEVDELDPVDLAVYKPRRGEAPLWDFPTGTLHRREVAAYELSVALGWDLVPETVLREDAPFDVGSLQRFVRHDPQRHYFTLLETGDGQVRGQLLDMVVFDLVIDNADRKAGHVLLDAAATGTRIRLVDHGVAFNVERKLRTVAWDLAGETIPGERLADVDRVREALDGELGTRLGRLLDDAEVWALRRRVEAVLALAVLPEPSGPYPYPWPLL